MGKEGTRSDRQKNKVQQYLVDISDSMESVGYCILEERLLKKGLHKDKMVFFKCILEHE